MSNHKISSGIAVSAFGLASATMYMSPSAEASIINLTPTITPSSVAFPTTSRGERIDLGIAEALGLGTADKGFDFAINNDIINNKGIFNYQTNTAGTDFDYGNIISFVFIGRSNYLSSSNPGFATWVSAPSNATGTAFVGFRTTFNVGWFQLDWGGAGGPVTVLAAAIESKGDEGIHVGSVPEPSTLGLGALGLLAAGAARRRRHGQAARRELQA